MSFLLCVDICFLIGLHIFQHLFRSRGRSSRRWGFCLQDKAAFQSPILFFYVSFYLRIWVTYTQVYEFLLVISIIAFMLVSGVILWNKMVHKIIGIGL